MARRLLFLAAFAFGLGTALSALAQVGCVPNPNLNGQPFVDGCPIPAAGLNKIPTVPLALTDSKGGAITTIGSAITAASEPGVSADLIESYVFCTAPGTATSCGGGNYDAVAGIGIMNSGTTTNIVAGVSGYVLAEQAFSGSGPSAVALFGAGAVTVDNGEIWGANINVSDRQYRVADSGTHNRRVTGVEADVSASYPDTTLTAIFAAGNSVVQPTNSTAFAVLGQDFSAATPGSIAKWTQAYYSYPGVATHFANVGQLTSSTVNSNSQDMIFGAYAASVGYTGQFYFGLASPTNFGSTTVPTFNTNYGLQTATGGVTARATTNQIVQLGGIIDLGTGASIESRNDANSLVLPLEILASNILLNSNTIQVNNGGGVTSAVNCPSGITAGTVVVINGIVTHC